MKRWHKGYLLVALALFTMALWSLWYAWNRDGTVTPINLVGALLVYSGGFFILRIARVRRLPGTKSVRDLIAEEDETHRPIDVGSDEYSLFIQGGLCTLDSNILFFHAEKTFQVFHNGEPIGGGAVHHMRHRSFTETFKPTRMPSDWEIENTLKCVVRTYGLHGRRLYQRPLALKRLAPFEEPN